MELQNINDYVPLILRLLSIYASRSRKKRVGTNCLFSHCSTHIFARPAYWHNVCVHRDRNYTVFETTFWLAVNFQNFGKNISKS